LGLLSFGVAQICYSITLLVGYFVYFVHRIKTKRTSEIFYSVRQLFPQFETSFKTYDLIIQFISFLISSGIRETLNSKFFGLID
jgi:hypothetical protein